jgi:hypothetical protein
MDLLDKNTEPQVSNQESLLEPLTFSIILKYWRKASRSFDVKISLSHCKDQQSFLEYIKKLYEVKTSHCLEEVWVLQKAGPLEPKIGWVKELNGRIKINVPQSYKEFLLKKSATIGKAMFEDPNYGESD